MNFIYLFIFKNLGPKVKFVYPGMDNWLGKIKNKKITQFVQYNSLLLVEDQSSAKLNLMYP